MSHSDESKGAGHAVAWTLALALLAPFMPWILACVEYLIFHSTHVEDICRKVGIHDALSKIYEPIFKLLRSVLRL